MNNTKHRKKQIGMIRLEITDQLDAQKVSYTLLTPKELVDLEVEQRWRKAFIGKRTAPHLEQYKWHIFSYNPDYGTEGELATAEYLKQYPADLIIFNERLEYGIQCVKADTLPTITMVEFYDDAYICHHNMKWTYVIPHERSTMGPFFVSQ